LRKRYKLRKKKKLLKMSL